jgi:hypothetical protein
MGGARSDVRALPTREAVGRGAGAHVAFGRGSVGGGKKALPDDVRLSLELLDERRFRSGFVYVRYATRAGNEPRSLSRDEFQAEGRSVSQSEDPTGVRGTS